MGAYSVATELNVPSINGLNEKIQDQTKCLYNTGCHVRQLNNLLHRKISFFYIFEKVYFLARFRTPFQTESFCSDFDCHLKSKPFDVRTLFNHYNTGLVRYIWDLKYRLVWISNGQKKFKWDLKSGNPNI